jgi:phage gpG-like protein
MASGMTIKVVGMKDVQRKLNRVKKAVPKEAVRAINKSLLLAEKEVKINLSGKILNVGTGGHNYRGGRLRRSFGVARENLAKINRLWGQIGSNVDYARIHEYGGKAGRNLSVNLKARKYFSKAIKKSMPNIHKLFDKAITRMVKA